jgi:hypothetical protein
MGGDLWQHGSLACQRAGDATTWELVIDLQTLSRFEGRFPEPFLRGATIPDSLKHLLPALS